MISKTKDKSLQMLIKEADAIFSKFIRYRDMKDGKVICFICGAKIPFAEAQAMHYVDRDQMATRYNETNVHGGCEDCNCFDPRHRENYRDKMWEVYGIQRVAAIKIKSNSLQKFMRFEVEDLIEMYTEKVKQQRKILGL